MIPDTVIVGILALAGTVFTSLWSSWRTTSLVNYRIEQLERKVDKHNSVVERVYKLEGEVAELQNEVRENKKTA